MPAEAGPRAGAGRDDGQPIELEVWRISHAGLGRLIGGVRPPLSIGAVELVDGSTVLGLRLRLAVVASSSRDVTAWGGWRAFVAAAPAAALPG